MNRAKVDSVSKFLDAMPDFGFLTAQYPRTTFAHCGIARSSIAYRKIAEFTVVLVVDGPAELARYPL
jgi:hypothetical protein